MRDGKDRVAFTEVEVIQDAGGRDTGGVAGDLFFAPRLPILDTAWP